MICCDRMNSSGREKQEEEGNQAGVAPRIGIERKYRICPSKLSKREIEDLYYKILHENQNLKKTVNMQDDKIKQLSVAMRRMSRDNPERRRASFMNMDKDKDCCVGTKNVVNKQKESIFELRKENEQLAERIKQLNMKLCSAKQFLNRRPSVQSRCPKCAARASASGVRNLSSSTLPTKGSEVNDKIKSASFHQHCVSDSGKDDDSKPLKKDESTETRDLAVKKKDASDKPEPSCDENKCKTLMEELRQKIGSLEDELSKTHEEYSGRISRLEQEVVELQKQNLRVSSDSAARAKALRDAQAQSDDLAVKLAVEKSKVAELETLMKASDMSHQIANTIEGQLAKRSPSVPPPTRRSSLRTEKVPGNQAKATVSSSSTSPPYTPIVMSRRMSVGDKNRAKSTVISPAIEEGKEKEDTDTEKTSAPSDESSKSSKKKKSKVICQCNVPNKKSKVKCECGPEILKAGQDDTDPCSTCYPSNEKAQSSSESRKSSFFMRRKKSKEKTSKVICECDRTVKKSKSKVKCECPKEFPLKRPDGKENKEPCVECYLTPTPQNVASQPEAVSPPENSMEPQVIDQDALAIQTNSGFADVGTSPMHSYENLKTITPSVYSDGLRGSSYVPIYQPKPGFVTPASDKSSVPTVPTANSTFTSVATGQIGETVPVKRIHETLAISVKEVNATMPRDSIGTASFPSNSASRRRSSAPGETVEIEGIISSNRRLSASPPVAFEPLNASTPTVPPRISVTATIPTITTDGSAPGEVSNTPGNAKSRISEMPGRRSVAIPLGEEGTIWPEAKLQKSATGQVISPVATVADTSGNVKPAGQMSDKCSEAPGQVSDSVPTITVETDDSVPKGTGEKRNSLPTGSSQVIDSVPLGTNERNETVLKGTNETNDSVPNGTDQTKTTTADAADPMNTTPGSDTQKGDASDQTQNSPTAIGKVATSSSTGLTSSSMPSSTEDTEEGPKKPIKPRDSIEIALQKSNTDARRSKQVDGLGTAPLKVSNQADNTALSVEKSEPDDKNASVNDKDEDICDKCGKPVQEEKNPLSQIPTKSSMQALATKIENAVKAVIDNVEGTGQSKAKSGDEEPQYRAKKPLDDSGYYEPKSTPETSKRNIPDDDEDSFQEQERLNKELLEKITSLQAQLDNLKIAAAGESPPSSPPLQSAVDRDDDKEDRPPMKPEDSLQDIVRNMNKIDVALKHKESCPSGQGKLDEANRRWVDYDLVSDDNMFSDKASIVSPHSIGKEDKLDRNVPNDNRYQIPGPIPTTSTPLDRRVSTSKKDNQRPSRDIKKHPAERTSSASFEHRESIQIGANKHRESRDKNRPDLPILVQSKADDTRSCRQDLDKGTMYDLSPKSVGVQAKSSENDENSAFMPPDYVSLDAEPQKDEAKPELVEIAMCEASTQVCRCRTGVKVGTALLRSCSGTLRVETLPGPSSKFKRCVICSGRRVSGITKVACPYQPPQTIPTDTNSPYNADQTVQSLRQTPFQVHDQPDGCLNENTRKVCIDLLARPEEENPTDIKRKCGCSNARTCKSGICRPKSTRHIFDALVDKDKLKIIGGKSTDTDSSSAEQNYQKESPPRSPGERRDHSSYSTSPTTDYGTLSEGEIPADSPRGPTKLSQEKQTETTYSLAGLTAPTPSQKMAAMLEAISEELTTCRQLLQAKKPTQQPSTKTRDASASAMGPSQQEGASQISLRRVDAKPRIGDVVTPKCIFTLHIGTIVLSDEAVINSSGMSLVLRWQLYEQNVAMTRMRTGRVVHFDFSTEYDVRLTGEFLEYLKREEMPIVICDISKPDEPFASCSLPLRDALLHANRRADMSLALVAGPRLQASRAAADPLDGGDEVGVLDLWCCLHVDPAALPAINKAIAKNTVWQHRASSSAAGGSSIMPQLDEHDDIHLSTDLDFTNRPRHPSIRPADIENMKAEHANIQKEAKLRRQSFPGSLTGLSRERDADLLNSRSEIPEYPMKSQVSFDEKRKNDEMENTEIIVNKVDLVSEVDSPEDNPANIKSTREMKKALEKSTINHELPRKNLENLMSPSALSLSSRSFWKRRPLPRQRLSLSQELDNTSNHHYFANGPGKPEMVAATQTARQDLEFPFGKPKPQHSEELGKSDSDIYSFTSKHDSSKRLLDANKAMEAFKKVKIRHRPPQTPLETTAEVPVPTEHDKAEYRDRMQNQVIDITIQWLALNDECEAMSDADVQRLYVAYSFLGKNGAELETPISLPKPKQYTEKCVFDFRKTFQLTDCELQAVGRLARCRSSNKRPNKRDCVVFTVVSEPAEDPLAIHNCEDVGYAYLYLGDILAYSSGSDTYTEVLPIHPAAGGDVACGVLAIKVDGLDVVRKSLLT